MPPHPDAVIVAEKTGHTRFLDLCDPDNPAYNADYLPVVARIARGEDAPPVTPSLARRAAHFAGAVVQHVATGMKTLDADAVKARLAVCNAPCDQRLPGGVCAGCGCNLKLKASWADQDCPLGKWPAMP